MGSQSGVLVFSEDAQRAQSVKLARYFSTLKGESDADAASLAARVRELAGADDFDSAGVAAVLADETPLVAQIPDKELEGVTNLLHAFVALLKSPERTRALIKAVGASPARPGPRLRLLTTIYNAQPETDALRCDAFEAIVEVAAASNELDVLDEFLPRLDAEMVRWGIGADKSREIYLMLSEKYAAQGSQEASLQSYNLLFKHLQTYESVSPIPDSLAPQTTKTIVAALTHPALFNLEEAYNLKSVQSLRGKSPAFELLELFLNSDLAAYRKWCAGNPGKLAELGLDEKATERKMRMLSLAGLAAGKEGKEVAYGTITQALEIPEGEVEVWVIDAIRAGLLDARMNQVTKTVAIRRSTVRAFTQEHWKQLASKLEGWKSGLQEVLQVLGNARLLVESQQQVVEAK